MIYKFYNEKSGYSLEFEHKPYSNLFVSQEKDVVSISIIEEETDLFYNIELKKQDIYKLIGALHLLHKEMK